MNKNIVKSSIKVVSNVLLFIALALMVLTVWLEDNFYLSVATISLGVVGVLVSLFTSEKFTLKVFVKELNIYFFIVTIIVSVSCLVANKTLFYIGMVLFILMIVLYLIPLFVEEKEDKKQKGKNKK